MGLAGALACLSPILWGWPWSYEGLRSFVIARRIAHHWRFGDLVPVWSSTAGHGFGSPSLALYHKLFFMLAGGLMLPGLGNGAAVFIALLATMLAGFVLTARAVRLLLGGPHLAIEIACGLTTISCNYATTNWMIRGDVSELAAEMLLPALFGWCFVLLRTGRFSIAIGPVLAAIGLAHSGTAAFSLLPLLAAVSIAFGRFGWGVARHWPVACLASVAIFAAILVPFALPAETMARYAEIDWLPFSGTPRTTHRPLADMLIGSKWETVWPHVSQSVQIDPGLLVGGAVGLVALGRRAARRSGVDDPGMVACGGFLVAVVAIEFALQTKAAFPFYDLLPGLRFIQFSWRLLSFLSVALVLLAAIGLRWLGEGRGARALPFLGAALVLSTVPNKLWAEQHHLRTLPWPAIRDADLGKADPWEYRPRVAAPGLWEHLRRTDAIVTATTRCATHWITDPSRERAVGRISVDCAQAGPTRLALFVAPGMRFSVGGTHVQAVSDCQDPRASVVLPQGRSIVVVRFPTLWSVMADRSFHPPCPLVGRSGRPGDGGS